MVTQKRKTEREEELRAGLVTVSLCVAVLR
jgi:hypothetical protein